MAASSTAASRSSSRSERRDGRAIWKPCSSARPSSGASAPDAKVLAQYQGDPVLVEQGRHLVATFHPELTDDSRIHLMFLEKITLADAAHRARSGKLIIGGNHSGLVLMHW